MHTPFLRRFTEPFSASAMPQLRMNAETQTTEALQDGRWIPSIEAKAFASPQTTKTGVETESTDYR